MEKCHLTNGAANPTTNQHQGIDPKISRQLAEMGFRSYQADGGFTIHERDIGTMGKIVVFYPKFMQLVIGSGGVLHLTSQQSQ
ncbi:hypothetical protein SAMN05421747_10417 [Parapedobacter composti]|uniref:Uncharacterized protein n=1 Tax=Parapedobacter composti TaxID=623281 RepID=A0A1I1GDR2_9SPHI|nr:hypothetical protein [Parapedobacter composti]SFC07473.1 hypothetical protein SAMN05421747_10417 [Parapedobacter composti]